MEVSGIFFFFFLEIPGDKKILNEPVIDANWDKQDILLER